MIEYIKEAAKYKQVKNNQEVVGRTVFVVFAVPDITQDFPVFVPDGFPSVYYKTADLNVIRILNSDICCCMGSCLLYAGAHSIQGLCISLSGLHKRHC